MADKVVQLVDKNSNNLYPVAGSAITNAISTGAISNQAVTNAKLGDTSVTTAKLADGAVTTAKIADANVTTAKIANKNVTAQKINFETIPMCVFANNTTQNINSNGNFVVQFSKTYATDWSGKIVLNNNGAKIGFGGKCKVSALLQCNRNGSGKACITIKKRVNGNIDWSISPYAKVVIPLNYSGTVIVPQYIVGGIAKDEEIVICAETSGGATITINPNTEYATTQFILEGAPYNNYF